MRSPALILPRLLCRGLMKGCYSLTAMRSKPLREIGCCQFRETLPYPIQPKKRLLRFYRTSTVETVWQSSPTLNSLAPQRKQRPMVSRFTTYLLTLVRLTDSSHSLTRSGLTTVIQICFSQTIFNDLTRVLANGMRR